MSLRERREVVSLYRDAGTAGGVLFSVVRVAGSSYRQPGARMLALSDGQTAGTLSGGCLEADLLRRAAWTVRSGAVVEQFSTAFDDTSEIPYGLGCGGIVDLLAEPVEAPEAEALLGAMEATLRGEERLVATLLPDETATSSGHPLRRVVLDSGGDVLFASNALQTPDVVLLRSLLRKDAPEGAFCQYIQTPLGDLFRERFLPVQRLVIFGAGEDARPLARMAQEMGWLPVVVDSRANRATSRRFPAATCILCSTALDVPVLPADAVVLMTHSYQHDRDLLADLLPLAPRYLGLLGARHRSALLLQEAATLAGMPLAWAVERTHAPIGLEVGGEGPEAVALAIVAEVQSVLFSHVAPAGVESRRLTLQDVDRLLLTGPVPLVYANCSLPLPDHSASQAVDR